MGVSACQCVCMCVLAHVCLHLAYVSCVHARTPVVVHARGLGFVTALLLFWTLQALKPAPSWFPWVDSHFNAPPTPPHSPISLFRQAYYLASGI